VEAVVQSIIQANADAMKAHLERLFAPVRDEYPDGLIELRYGNPPNRSAYFPIDASGISTAATYAEARNATGDNIYVGVNPRKPHIDRDRSASDTDVEIAAWHFADLDRAEAVEAARHNLPLRPGMIVMTGTQPNQRPHLYWQLEEPVRNLEAWTQAQRAIATKLGGDAVINPSRIMRLAGSVNFPPPHKVGRGYTVECCQLLTSFADERPPVAVEAIQAAFPATPLPLLCNGLEAVTGQSPAPLQAGQTTLSAMRQTRVADLIAACQSGNEWHNNMVRLVAHMAAIGRQDAEIMGLAHALTMPGYSVADTMRDMGKALSSARTKWNIPEPVIDVAAEEVERQRQSEPLRGVDAFDFDERAIPVRPWIVPGVILSGYTHLLAAPGGSGKSLLTLQIATMLATGQQWGPFTPRKRARSAIINVEDDLHEQRRRLSAARRVMKPEPGLLRGMVHLIDSDDGFVVAAAGARNGTMVTTPVVTRMVEFIRANAIDVLFVDPFAETFEGDENDNSQVKWAMKIWRDEIARATGCAVYLVHHTTKYANGGAGDQNIVRGGGAIVNSTRISSTLMPMTQEEADAIGIEQEDRHLFVRFDDAKANQSLKTNKARWFKKQGVTLDNGTGLYPGDEVGALVPWAQPGAFDNITVAQCNLALDAINEGLIDEDGVVTGVRFGMSKKGGAGMPGGRWVGNAIQKALSVSPAVAQKIAYEWLGNGVLIENEFKDPTDRKLKIGLFVDPKKRPGDAT
jgi:hypothetical protein